MQNPWRTPPRGPRYILPDDRALVDEINGKVDARLRIRTERLPTPFVAKPHAPIVVLSNNPGHKPDRPDYHEGLDFARLWRANLLHEKSDYPFFLLNPKVSPEHGGRQYWQKKLRRPIEDSSREQEANSVFVVEFFPYHSQSFRHGGWQIPSQQYSFWLVRQAIERKSVFKKRLLGVMCETFDVSSRCRSRSRLFL